MDAFCGRGRLRAALGAVQRLVDAGGEPDARIYDRLVDCAMRARDFQRALQARLSCGLCLQVCLPAPH